MYNGYNWLVGYLKDRYTSEIASITSQRNPPSNPPSVHKRLTMFVDLTVITVPDSDGDMYCLHVKHAEWDAWMSDTQCVEIWRIVPVSTVLLSLLHA
jgi:hypothetical protein